MRPRRLAERGNSSSSVTEDASGRPGSGPSAAAAPVTSQDNPATAAQERHSRLIHPRWRRAVAILAFIYITAIGINAIGEIDERGAVHGLLAAELRDLEAAIRAPRDPAASTNTDEHAHLLQRRALLATELGVLRHLSTAGALDERMTLTSIRRRVYGLQPTGTSFIKIAFGPLGPVIIPSMIEVSSDGRMYATLVVCACVLGCIVQYFRAGSHSLAQTVVVGVGAGIVSYLAIAAGKIGMVLHEEKVNVAGGVLLGFLAGVFSGHVYEIVEALMQRLKTPRAAASTKKTTQRRRA